MSEDKNLFLPISLAAKLSSYNSDYLTQLCRKKQLVCIQVSKLWFISISSLDAYLREFKKANLDKELAKQCSAEIKEDLSGKKAIYLDSEIYLTSKEASKLSSYHRDYLTQLARKSEIRAKKLGKVWLFNKNDLTKHLESKDRVAKIKSEQILPGHKTTHERRQDFNKDNSIISNKRQFVISKPFNYEAESVDELIPNLKSKEKTVPIKKLYSNKKQIHNDIKNNPKKDKKSANIDTAKEGTLYLSRESQKINKKTESKVKKPIKISVGTDKNFSEVYTFSRIKISNPSHVTIYPTTGAESYAYVVPENLSELLKCLIYSLNYILIFASLFMLALFNLMYLGILEEPVRTLIF